MSVLTCSRVEVRAVVGEDLTDSHVLDQNDPRDLGPDLCQVRVGYTKFLRDTGHDQEFRKWEPYLLIPVGLVTYRFIHLELWDDSALWVFVVQAACALVVARAVVSVATGRAFLKLSIAWRRLLVAWRNSR